MLKFGLFIWFVLISSFLKAQDNGNKKVEQ